MGRSVRTANQVIIDEQQAFADFRRALRREDQRIFDALFAGARRHTAAISQAAHALPFEAILLAMVVEQAKEIDRLRRLLDESTC
ncbi:MAG: hypothetical protein ACK2U5_00940 [Candidatus Promineifilaceae bacterium]|jgi:hypothetical protein